MLAQSWYEENSSSPTLERVREKSKDKHLTPHARLVKEAFELFPGSQILGHFPS